VPGYPTSPLVPPGNRHLDYGIDGQWMVRRWIMRTKVISDEVESLRIVLDFGIEAGEIEPVEDVIIFYFAEIFVTLG